MLWVTFAPPLTSSRSLGVQAPRVNTFTAEVQTFCFIILLAYTTALVCVRHEWQSSVTCPLNRRLCYGKLSSREYMGILTLHEMCAEAAWWESTRQDTDSCWLIEHIWTRPRKPNVLPTSQIYYHHLHVYTEQFATTDQGHTIDLRFLSNQIIFQANLRSSLVPSPVRCCTH